MTSHSNNRKVRLTVEPLEDRAVPAAVMSDTSPFEAFGSVAGSIGVVQVVHTDDPTNVVYSFIPYGTAFTGGVRVAVGGVNTSDPNKSQYLVTAPGPGGGPEIRVYNLANGAPVFNFWALTTSFLGGAFVAAGDVNADGYDDIIVGAGAGGGPQVQVFSGNPADAQGQTPGLLSNFFAYPPSFLGGVSVAAGDVAGDGQVAVVTGTGPGGGPIINEFEDGGIVGSFYALNPAFRGGISVATIPDVNIPSQSDVIVGAGPGGGPQVQLFASTSGTLRLSFFATDDPSFNGGINVASYVATVASNGVSTAEPVIVVGTDSAESTFTSFYEDNLQRLSFGSPPVTAVPVLPGLAAGVYVAADNSGIS